jgi:hypothetical protein
LGSTIADNINGTKNGDTLNGNGGNDIIEGNAGADTIDGGAGDDFILSDNAGTGRVEKYVVTTAGAGTATITLSTGDTLAATFATDGDAVIAALDTAAKAHGNYGKLFTTSVTANGGTTTDDELVVTYLKDGNIAGSATTSAATLAVNTTGTNSTAVGGTQVTAGTDGDNAADTLTGGAGTDTFGIQKGDGGAAPSASVFDTITDFEANKDVIDYVDGSITIVTNGTATSGVAKITSAGIATFHADDDTFAEQLTAVEAAIQTGTATSGQSAMWQSGDDAYLFISEGTDGVDAGDMLVKLVGIDLTATATDTMTLSSGNLTLA